MKKIAVFICFILTLNTILSAQKEDLTTVKSGYRILDFFPFESRYRYPQFIQGRVIFKNNIFSSFKLNYNYLLGEVEFIQGKDTMVIVNKKDIRHIVIEKDSFYYDKCYMEVVAHNGPIRIMLNEYIKLKEIQKKDSYGVSGTGSSTESYNSLPADGNYYKLHANSDMVFQRMRDYYLSTPDNGFQPFTKKNVLKLFPKNENAIKDYLKSNDIDFGSREDLIKLAGFLQSLMKLNAKAPGPSLTEVIY